MKPYSQDSEVESTTRAWYWRGPVHTFSSWPSSVWQLGSSPSWTTAPWLHHDRLFLRDLGPARSPTTRQKSALYHRSWQIVLLSGLVRITRNIICFSSPCTEPPVLQRARFQRRVCSWSETQFHDVWKPTWDKKEDTFPVASERLILLPWRSRWWFRGFRVEEALFEDDFVELNWDSRFLRFLDVPVHDVLLCAETSWTPQKAFSSRYPNRQV